MFNKSRRSLCKLNTGDRTEVLKVNVKITTDHTAESCCNSAALGNGGAKI